MNISNQNWLFPKNLSDAKIAQQQMAQKVVSDDTFYKPISYIAGVDISNTPFDPEQMIYAAIVVFAYPSLEIVEVTTAKMKQEFPYIRGYLGFREVPVLVEAYKQLSIRPDLLMVDGHGVSHPRGLGIASHLGVLLDLPSIGVAKSILVGKPANLLTPEVGGQTSLIWKEKELGICLRTKKNCTPLILSVGHNISLKTAEEWVIRCLKGYRLPETTRQAHLAANAYRRTLKRV